MSSLARLLGVWTRVTGGEHLFAPAVMAGPAAPRSPQPNGRDRLTYVDLRWPHLATEPARELARGLSKRP